MNVPRDESEIIAQEVAYKFIQDNLWVDQDMRVENLAELILHAYACGAFNQLDQVHIGINPATNEPIIRGQFPKFNVPYPIPETLPTGDK